MCQASPTPVSCMRLKVIYGTGFTYEEANG
jgi:hypothetical protein